MLPALVFAGLMILPGAVVLYGSGARRVTELLGFAPIASVAAAGVGGPVLRLLGVRWSMPSFVVLAAVATALLVGIRFLVARVMRGAAFPTWRLRLLGDGRALLVGLAGLVASTVIGAFQYLAPNGRADAITFSYDTIWHYAVVRRIITTGDASSLDTGLVDGTAGNHFYPSAWHALVALTSEVTGASIPVATQASTFVLFAVVWPLSAAVLANRLFGRRLPLIAAAVVVAPLFAAFPSGFTAFGVLSSNLLSFAIAPACVAVGVGLLERLRRGDRVDRVRIVVDILLVAGVLAAILMAQPNSVFTVGVILLPLVVRAAWSVARRRAGGQRRPAVITVAMVLVVSAALWVLVHDSSFLGRTRSVDWPAALTGPQAFGEFVLQGFEGVPAQWWLVAVLGVGVVLAWRTRGTRWVPVSYLLLGALYMFGQGFPGGPHSLRDYLTGFWYHDSFRLAAATVLLGAPLAAHGVAAIAESVGRWAGARRARAAAPMVSTALAVVLLVVSVGSLLDGALGAKRDVMASLVAVDSDAWLKPQKAAFLRRVAATVEPGVTVANDPDDGSAFGYSLDGIAMLFPALPGNWIGAPSPDQVTVLRALGTAASDPAVCTAATRLRIGYVLQLGAPRTASSPRNPIGYDPAFWAGIRIGPTTPGFDPVLEDGDMILWRMTACD